MSDQAPAQAAPQAAPPPAPPQGKPGTGPLGIGGWIFVVIGALVLLAGLGVIAIHLTQRDDSGYYTSDITRVSSQGYAVYATGLDLGSKESADALGSVLGRVRVRAQAEGGRPVFIGIGPRADVNRYLADSVRSKVEDVNGPNEVTYKQRFGPRRPAPPGDEIFWSARASGGGVQTLNWKAEEGSFSIVVMNPDGSRPVRARVTVGAKAPAVLWIGFALLGVAVAFGGIGAAMIVADRRKRAGSG